ncbi:hypothetical protein BaRGS_00035035 [Batillaria attramentaria]|uniref:Uncharacterized protein n=1 Tax=Batillaria attramentaria TaxID=370345 RepID=A0ABD0JFJ4_9CAEN
MNQGPSWQTAVVSLGQVLVSLGQAEVGNCGLGQKPSVKRKPCLDLELTKCKQETTRLTDHAKTNILFVGGFPRGSYFRTGVFVDATWFLPKKNTGVMVDTLALRQPKPFPSRDFDIAVNLSNVKDLAVS